MSDPTDEMHKQARAQTDPLFFQDYLLAHGHNVDTKNATATFVRFGGRVYVCTCRHVVEILTNRQERGHSVFPTLALMVDRAMLPLSFFTPDGLQLGQYVPNASANGETVDIAIAEITGTYWDLLTSRKNKSAIDLDEWREPRWSQAQMLIAAGYPDEHKQSVSDSGEEKVIATLTLVAAAADGAISKFEPEVHMRSRLGEPHGYYFSGMSGGPMYVQQDELIIPVGILCEGWPATSNKPVIFKPNGTDILFDGQDIIVQGLTLTPSNFEKWLKARPVKG
jgi:hypothetical protein